MAIDCKPEEQKRLMVMAGTSEGSPARWRRDARNIVACFALGHGAAEDHVVDFLGVQARDSANRFQKGDGREVVGARGAQSALARFPDRRANGAYDDGFSHRGTCDC